MKKIVSLVLCLSMLLVMLLGTTAFGAVDENSKGTFSVKDIQNGATVTAYKIIKANFKEGYFAGYSYVDEVQNWMKTNSYKTYADDISDLGKATPEFQKGFYSDLIAAMTASPALLSLSPIDSKTSDGNPVEFNNMPLGQYLLIAEGGDYIYLPAVANIKAVLKDNDYVAEGETISMKKETVTIDKTVNGADMTTAGLDEELNYVISAAVPEYPAKAINKFYEIKDELSAGLKLVDGSITVQGVKSSVATTIPTTAYQLTTVGQTTTINFIDFDTIKDYDHVKVSYKAKLTSAAIVGMEGNRNDATLKYANNPSKSNSYTTKTDDAMVYTFGLKVYKIDGATVNDVAPTPLAGATFRLEKFVGSKWEPVSGAEKLITNSEGRFDVKQLKDGKYRLVELQAPDGFSMQVKDLEFQIVAEKVNGKLVAKVDGVELDGGYYSPTICNYRTVLPWTGGNGTIIFTVVGILLMVGAVTFLVIRKRMSSVVK